MNSISGIYNTIQISKNEIPRITANSGLLDVIIHSEFSNSNNYRDNDGNFFLNRNTFPISNDQWRALREAIEDGYVYDPKLRAFIKHYFMFKSNLVPRVISVTNSHKGKYIPKLGKKQRQRTRKMVQRLIENNFGPTKKELKKEELEAERKFKEENELAKLEQVLSNINIGKYNEEIKRAQTNRTKYPKSGIRPSKKNITKRNKYTIKAK